LNFLFIFILLILIRVLLHIFLSVDCQFVCYFSVYSVCFRSWLFDISIPNYNANEFVDIFLVLALVSECRSNYRRVAALYRQRFSRRNHSNDSMIYV